MGEGGTKPLSSLPPPTLLGSQRELSCFSLDAGLGVGKEVGRRQCEHTAWALEAGEMACHPGPAAQGLFHVRRID